MQWRKGGWDWKWGLAQSGSGVCMYVVCACEISHTEASYQSIDPSSQKKLLEFGG